MATIGSVPELKQRFGEYTIEIEENEGFTAAQLIKEILPQAKKAQSSDKNKTFKVGISTIEIMYLGSF